MDPIYHLAASLTGPINAKKENTSCFYVVEVVVVTMDVILSVFTIQIVGVYMMGVRFLFGRI